MKKILGLVLMIIALDLLAQDERDLELVGKRFTTKKPFAYIVNQPWYLKSEPFIQRNAPTFLKHNRELSELRNACSNCLDRKRLITPIRLEFVPTGTSYLVKGIFSNRSKGSEARIEYYVLEDSSGRLSEVMSSSFQLMIDSSNLNEVEKNAILAADLYDKGRTVILKTCREREQRVLDAFREDFSIEKDIVKKESSEIFGGASCTEYTFLNLSAYLTYRHYKDEWDFVSQRDVKNSRPEECIDVPTELNKGSLVCSKALRKLIFDGDESKIESLLKGWKIEEYDFRNLEESSGFKSWDKKLQLLLVENRPDREVMVSTCKSLDNKDAVLNCYLENSDCREFKVFRNMKDCFAQREKRSKINIPSL